jgi:hypothetical protein
MTRTTKELTELKNEKIAKIRTLEDQKNVILDKINDGNRSGTYLKQFEDLRIQIDLEKNLLERLKIDIRNTKIYEMLAGDDKEFEDLDSEGKKEFLKAILDSEKNLPILLADRIREELAKVERMRKPIY